jgi:hypothetical protein
MIEHVGLHAPQPAYFIDDLLMMRQQRAELHTALTVSLKFAIGTHQLRIARQERKSPTLS